MVRIFPEPFPPLPLIDSEDPVKLRLGLTKGLKLISVSGNEPILDYGWRLSPVSLCNFADSSNVSCEKL